MQFLLSTIAVLLAVFGALLIIGALVINVSFPNDILILAMVGLFSLIASVFIIIQVNILNKIKNQNKSNG